MKNTITINVRVFPVQVHNHRTGKEAHITVPVTKEQLQAAQLVSQSSKELIERLCDRQGYTVLDIGQPHKLSMDIDLAELVKQYETHRGAKAKWDYLYGGVAD